MREEARREEAGRVRREAERRNTIVKGAQLISKSAAIEKREIKCEGIKGQVASFTRYRVSQLPNDDGANG